VLSWKRDYRHLHHLTNWLEHASNRRRWRKGPRMCMYVHIYTYMRVRKKKKKRRHFENRHYIIFIYIFIYKFASCKSKVIYLKAQKKRKSQITSEWNKRMMKIIINRLNTSVCQLIIFYFLFTLMCSCFSSVNSFIHYHLAGNDHLSLDEKKWEETTHVLCSLREVKEDFFYFFLL